MFFSEEITWSPLLLVINTWSVIIHCSIHCSHHEKWWKAEVDLQNWGWNWRTTSFKVWKRVRGMATAVGHGDQGWKSKWAKWNLKDADNGAPTSTAKTNQSGSSSPSALRSWWIFMTIDTMPSKRAAIVGFMPRAENMNVAFAQEKGSKVTIKHMAHHQNRYLGVSNTWHTTRTGTSGNQTPKQTPARLAQLLKAKPWKRTQLFSEDGGRKKQRIEKSDHYPSPQVVWILPWYQQLFWEARCTPWKQAVLALLGFGTNAVILPHVLMLLCCCILERVKEIWAPAIWGPRPPSNSPAHKQHSSNFFDTSGWDIRMLSFGSSQGTRSAWLVGPLVSNRWIRRPVLSEMSRILISQILKLSGFQ